MIWTPALLYTKNDMFCKRGVDRKSEVENLLFLVEYLESLYRLVVEICILSSPSLESQGFSRLSYVPSIYLFADRAGNLGDPPNNFAAISGKDKLRLTRLERFLGYYSHQALGQHTRPATPNNDCPAPLSP